MLRSTIALLLLATDPASAQLRPRRVGGAGVNAMGQQEEVPAAGMDEGAGAAGLSGLEGLEGMAQQLGANGGMPAMGKMMEMMAGGDLSNLLNNPMLKGLANANPELAQMLSDPEMMKEKIAEVAQLLNTEEGKGMASKMMEEMQSVMTDPDKLQQGLQQLVENPALKGFADAVPGLSEALSDPESMREQAEKTAELFQKMQDPEQMQECTPRHPTAASTAAACLADSCTQRCLADSCTQRMHRLAGSCMRMHRLAGSCMREERAHLVCRSECQARSRWPPPHRPPAHAACARRLRTGRARGPHRARVCVRSAARDGWDGGHCRADADAHVQAGRRGRRQRGARPDAERAGGAR